MSTEDRKSWGYTPMSILTLVVVVFVVWALAGGRPLFRGKGIKSTSQDVADDIRSTGREVSSSIRRTLE